MVNMILATWKVLSTLTQSTSTLLEHTVNFQAIMHTNFIMDIAFITAYISFLLIARVFYRIMKDPKYHCSCKARIILSVATGLQIIFLPPLPASELLGEVTLLCDMTYDASNSLFWGYHAFQITMNIFWGHIW
jgi:hypothetical protein